MSSAANWNERYTGNRVWSGAVNPTLEAATVELAAGTALDVGCGEGADAIWLAEQGWRVRGVDFSREALSRAESAAAERGLARRCDWIQADLSAWTTNHSYDLVTCHFFHEEPHVRERAWRAAVAAVGDGGVLIIVGHSPHETEELHGPPLHTRFTAQEVVTALALTSGWTVELSESERQGSGAHAGTRTDVVMVATRRTR